MESSARWQRSGMAWCEAQARTRARSPELCFHAGVQAQPAAGKTSANDSPRAAFAAQPSMLFDAIGPEFEKLQVSAILFIFYFSIICIIPFVPAAFYTDTKWHLLTDGWSAAVRLIRPNKQELWRQ